VSSFLTTGGLRLSGQPSFSRINSQYLYNLTGTSFQMYDFTNRSTPPTPTTVYDFKNAICLGTSFVSTWTTDGGVAGSDTVFAAGFSNSGGQGGAGALYVAVYKTAGNHCYQLNTQTGVVTNDGTVLGTVPNWTTIAGAGGFAVHNIKINKAGDWLVIVSTDSSCPTCKGPYFWQPGTLTVTQVGNASDGGHWTTGYAKFVNAGGIPSPGQFTVRPFATPATTTALIPAQNFPGGLKAVYDLHQGWNNVDVNDTYPFCYSTFTTNVPVPNVAWENEIDCASPVNGTVYRFAHTFSTAKSHRFNDTQSIGSISQDGRFYMWSSDWMGTLGSESGDSTCTVGTDCRGDVFVVELK
jgi:hypothetical protein